MVKHFTFSPKTGVHPNHIRKRKLGEVMNKLAKTRKKAY
jgi:hypothetical protein